ncbi:prephenate dehydratase [Limisalsivibrio acetivorans]|uniref:prephenate dehydratase n=1 Tax=Limisalsivibrio acetivorans TaxID=1304888 RepID=UPI0003B68C66|nr:prephenate dehydratase [Limisalsivibrio acetivorans]
MKELEKYRQEIDRLDGEILKLLNERAKQAIEVGEIKKKAGKPLYVPSRERKVYERLKEMNTGPLPNEAIRRVYREVISASLSLEEVQKVGYLGPEGTFTNLAAIKNFGLSAELVPVRSIPEVFDSVERGRLDYGIIPIENSLEGVVNHTLDMFVDSSLRICGEVFIEVSHHLMSQSGKIKDIKKIYSHSHAIAQCRKWLGENLNDIPVYEVNSTAKAAEMAANDPECAAIASEMAEMLYNLRIVERSIEDSSNNFTRFLIIGDFDPQATGNDKTSIVFSVAHQPGALYTALHEFAEHNISMTKIESRPSRKKAWEYVFYVDIDGHKDEEPVKGVLANFNTNVQYMKVLGSYPKGEK